MNPRSIVRPQFGSFLAMALFVTLRVMQAQSDSPAMLHLPKPEQKGGRPLMEVLRDRQSRREFSAEPIAVQDLSNVLWAAFGINRPANDHRTAPSAMNSQEIDLYVARSDGLWIYGAKSNLLHRISERDVRPELSGQPFVKAAPLTLIFVANLERLEKAAPTDRLFYAAADTGYISQNVYLYCASRGLATVVWAIGNSDRTREALRLKSDQRPILAQTLGHPNSEN